VKGPPTPLGDIVDAATSNKISTDPAIILHEKVVNVNAIMWMIFI
jgi:hypothetical protein